MTNVLEYLEQSAARVPDKTAYTDETDSITFKELLLLAKKIGTALAREIGVGCPVGVLVGRHIGCLAAFFGVLYSGNYYVPLDPDMPVERLQKILVGLHPSKILFCQKDKPANLPDSSLLFSYDNIREEPDDALLAIRRNAVLDVDPVYVIYTSGSTGMPKGIVISHRSVIDFIDWMAEELGYRQTDVFANQAPFYFDCSVKDLYLTLKLGACDHILPKKLFMFPTLLMDYLSGHGVTALTWATSAFHLVADSGILSKKPPRSLRLVAVGGEAMLARHLNTWRAALPETTFVNLYGPTEVTVDCTYHIIRRDYEDGEAVPIGKACNNKEVLLLDETLMPVPDGTPGEICVRGAGVAKGYFGEPEKTAAAFVQNPRSPYPDVIYRTGDIGVKNSFGELVFQSRKDGQIKHMGYRIELGEIERALGSLARIREAVCLYDGARDRIVCVYQGEMEPKELVSALSKKLPKYMIPNVYRPRPALPHNANGKLDRARMKQEYDREG